MDTVDFAARSETQKVGHARNKRTLAQSFWPRVHQPDEGCWDWQGVRSKSGHGQISYRGQRLGAHRVALELSLGRPLADGMFALHRCSRPPCCRPDHLYEGTPSQNMQDQYAQRERPSAWR